MTSHVFTLALLFAFELMVFGQPRQGAALLKTDIMGVFAHPDDETGMAGTLAYYAQGRGAVCANVYCTRGEGGGNMVGTQWGEALGILREAELRDCLQTLGVRYCYFLGQPDWAYTESAAATLEKWGKEKTLERLVRLVRGLRPEVIVTMNPAPTPGQHGHHQSAGILATEAFSAAADPRRFPEQIEREGLSVWQARKLFYPGSNALHVAAIQLDEKLRDGRTPGEIAAGALVNHRSQAFGNFSNSPWMRRPQTFTLVKSFVSAATNETDLLSGLPAPEQSLHQLHFARPARADAQLSFVPRPAFGRYQGWVEEQGIEHTARKYSVDLPLAAGMANSVFVELKSTAGMGGELEFSAPQGWQVTPKKAALRSSPGKGARTRVNIIPPPNARGDFDISALLSERRLEAQARAHLVPSGHIPRGRSWEQAAEFSIASSSLAEGKTSGEADSSAVFRLFHDGINLHAQVDVKDDRIVTNIAPNDIRGHWRSDSVEICLEGAGAVEHTLGSYKIGIFPFDSSGVVRGARDADANQGPIEQTSPGTKLWSERTPEGYRIRATIPFKEAGIKYTRGKMIAFNIIVYDGDKEGAAMGENINKSRIAWSPRPGVQGRPEDWGRMILD